jgi:Na+-driven multidrug efflux pump
MEEENFVGNGNVNDEWDFLFFSSYFQGVAVGCGWQAFVAYVNVGCYYIIGIPVGAVLGFKFDLGAKV